MTLVPSKGNIEALPLPAGLLPALYAVDVAHSRHSPITNKFRYRARYWLVDYDRLPEPTGFVGRMTRFERSDHPDVRALLAEEGISAERVVMLAMARTFGYVFNPISVFWCYAPSGDRVAVLAEVHNTYGESHTYLLRPDEDGQSRVDKVLYVSPFYPVDGSYDIGVSEPGASLSVTVRLHRGDDPPFVASLHGERLTPSKANVVWASLVYPALRTTILIHWQALRLWLRGLKVQPR